MREILMSVEGSTPHLSAHVAGIRGESNATNIRLRFDGSWDGLTRSVTFFDAKGKNPVTILMTPLLEDGGDYLFPIPAEPLALPGFLTLVAEGTKDGVRERSSAVALRVEDAPEPAAGSDPIEKTPALAEQLQGEIDALLGTVSEKAGDAESSAREAGEAGASAREAADAARGYAEAAEGASQESSQSAQRSREAMEGAQAAAESAAGSAQAARDASELASARAMRDLSNVIAGIPLEASAAPEGQWHSLRHMGGKFVAFGSAGVYSSPDGLTWAPDVSFPSGEWWDGAEGGGVSVLVGEGKFAAMSPEGEWTEGAMLSDKVYSAVAYGAGVFVAACGGKGTGSWGVPCWSGDGRTWQEITGPGAGFLSRWWRSVAFGGGKFILRAGDNALSLLSGDGKVWRRKDMLPIGLGDGLCWGDGKFVAVGTGGDFPVNGEEDIGRGLAGYSLDGESWRYVRTGSAGWSGVAWGAGRFVAVGAGNRTMQSMSGESWLELPAPGSYTCLAFSPDGRCAAIGEGAAGAGEETGLIESLAAFLSSIKGGE